MKNKLFKWVGGKKWLSLELNKIFLKYKKNSPLYYVEPFVGGLGSFIYSVDTLKKIGVKQVFLNDVNDVLINLYKDIKDSPNELFDIYSEIENDYALIPSVSNFKSKNLLEKDEIKKELEPARDYFNLIKVRYNELKENPNTETSALFLFLMQHCFNGIYRENSSGKFNVSYNWELALPNLDEKYNSILYYSKIFKEMNVVFSSDDCFDFMDRMKGFADQSLIYLDPPYINKKGGENNYNKASFGVKEQERLLDYCKVFKYVVFSNHENKLFKDFFKNNGFKIKRVKRSNVVSVVKSNRVRKVFEILTYKI